MKQLQRQKRWFSFQNEQFLYFLTKNHGSILVRIKKRFSHGDYGNGDIVAAFCFLIIKTSFKSILKLI